MTLRGLSIALFIGLLTVLVVVAQDAAESEASMIETGRAVYTSNGCIACHGLEAEGTLLAPPLAGTSEAIIRRQIRAPLGIMPNFPPETISADELDALVAYLLTLEPFDETIYEGERHQPEIGAEIIMRHWMVWVALEVEDVDSAREHIAFIMEYVESTHLQHMQTILDLLDEDEIHEAQHIVESMLADVIGFEDSAATLHLHLLLSAVRAEEYEEAAHQLEHYTNSEEHDETLAIILETLLTNEQYEQVETLLDSMLAEIPMDMEYEHDNDESDPEHD